jgi:hypothetical protein
LYFITAIDSAARRFCYPKRVEALRDGLVASWDADDRGGSEGWADAKANIDT